MERKNIKLGKTIIYPDSRPYIIAEIGVNHEGSLSQAKRLIDLAKEGGADAAKFQSYKADTLASKNSPAYWDTNKEPTQSQHELFQKYDQFNTEDYIALKEHCDKSEIEFISTPFDDNSIESLNSLVPFFKIASADITNIPFLRKITRKRKPILLSTGASTIDEINENLKKIVKNLGINTNKFNKCLIDEVISDKILNGRINAHEKYSINATPTIIINEKKLKGSADFKNIKKNIEKLI